MPKQRGHAQAIALAAACKTGVSTSTQPAQDLKAAKLGRIKLLAEQRREVERSCHRNEWILNSAIAAYGTMKKWHWDGYGVGFTWLYHIRHPFAFTSLCLMMRIGSV
jgi:hypothetical protein